jgi:hypothetical protein
LQKKLAFGQKYVGLIKVEVFKWADATAPASGTGERANASLATARVGEHYDAQILAASARS